MKGEFFDELAATDITVLVVVDDAIDPDLLLARSVPEPLAYVEVQNAIYL